jgi:di/tricarboxylate transporter
MMLRGMQANFYAHGADAVTASRKSLAALYGLVQEHASMLAFVEAFWLMGVVFLLMIPFLPLLQYTKRKPPQPAQPPQSEKLLRRTELPQPAQPEPEEEHHLVLH